MSRGDGAAGVTNAPRDNTMSVKRINVFFMATAPIGWLEEMQHYDKTAKLNVDWN